MRKNLKILFKFHVSFMFAGYDKYNKENITETKREAFI